MSWCANMNSTLHFISSYLYYYLIKFQLFAKHLIMKHSETILRSGNNKQLFYQEWQPDKEASTIILYIHGLGSHCSRLGHWAKRFIEVGIAFAAYDQEGHGRSEGKRGFPKSIRDLIRDVQIAIAHVRKQHPGKKLVLYGHSLGGCISINYCLSLMEQPNALIATSPWLELTNPPSKALVKILQPMVKLVPGLRISNGLDANDISRVTKEVDKYRTDPLVHNKISIGLFNSTRLAGLNAHKNISGIPCPVLLMHGSADQITSPRASQKFANNNPDRINFKLWEGGFHELHHEPEREAIFKYITNWLKEQKLSAS